MIGLVHIGNWGKCHGVLIGQVSLTDTMVSPFPNHTPLWITFSNLTLPQSNVDGVRKWDIVF